MLTLLLAALAPAPRSPGSRSERAPRPRRHDAARQAAAGDLLEHVARGERARDRPRAARRRRPPHLDDRRTGRDGPRLDSRHARAPAHSGSRRSATPRGPRSPRCGGCSACCERTPAPTARSSAAPTRPRAAQRAARRRPRRFGSAARLILSGAPVALDPGVELAAYRIVQEALTNARRHAPGRRRRRRAALRRARPRASGSATTGPGPPSARRGRPRAVGHARARRGGRRAAATPDRRPAAASWSRRRFPPTRARRSGAHDRRPRPTVRIVVADDHEVVRSGFAELLDTQPDFTVVGTAATDIRRSQLSRERRARRGPDGHPHARHGRDRGHPAARERDGVRA